MGPTCRHDPCLGLKEGLTAGNCPVIQHASCVRNSALPWNHVSCLYPPACAEVMQGSYTHARAHTLSDMLFILYYMCEWWNSSFIFTSSCVFLSPSYILLVFKPPEKMFPSFNANFWSRCRLFFVFFYFFLKLSWNSIYPADSIPPPHWPSSTPVSKYASFTVKQGGRGWRLGRCPAKPNRPSAAVFKAGLRLCLHTLSAQLFGSLICAERMQISGVDKQTDGTVCLLSQQMMEQPLNSHMLWNFKPAKSRSFYKLYWVTEQHLHAYSTPAPANEEAA